MQTQGAFNPLIRAGLRRDFRDEFNEGETEYNTYLKTGTTDTPEVMASIITGLSRLIELDDGEGISYQSPKMGPVVAGVDKEFGIGVMIGRKIMEDDQYGKIKASSKWLAHAAKMCYEYRGAGFLDDAFTGTTYKGYDGLAWCHTAHTSINTTATWANRLSQEVGLSMAGVTAMIDLYATLKDQNGDPIKMWPDKIVIGNSTGDWHRAENIFGNAKEPYTADNTDNIVSKRFKGINIVISRYKSSLKSYFMINSKYNDAQLLVKRAVKMEDSFDFNTGAALAKVTTRFLIWGVDPRGWVGANPS